MKGKGLERKKASTFWKRGGLVLFFLFNGLLQGHWLWKLSKEKKNAEKKHFGGPFRGG